MSRSRFVFPLAIALGTVAGAVQAEDTIVVPAGLFQVDHELHLIVANMSTDLVNAQGPGLKTVILVDTWYALAPAVAEVAVGTELPVLAVDSTPYHLYFTTLPLIGINTADSIQDEPKVHGNMVLSDSSGEVSFADLGIEFRGSSAQFWSKKSYLIEFWNDTIGTDKLDVPLLGMRSDDDWNLQAMYNEPLRMRNVVCNKLWRQIHTPYYLAAEPDAVTGVAMEYAELFINGAYQGIYGVSERIDRKQLKLKKYNGNIRGQLYKGRSWGASTFSSAPPFDNGARIWSGFEYEYPDEVTDWSDLYDFVDFVVNAPVDEFLDQYPSRFEVGNVVDYFIFLNLLHATDNAGKNIYIARYDAGTPYFYVPFDLDGTFGMYWDGSVENITDDLLLNGFYVRLLQDCRPGGFKESLMQRWNDLRTGMITHDTITDLFAQEYAYLETNGAYQRESIAWEDYEPDPTQLDFLSTWLTARLTYLDSNFNAPCDPIGITEQAIAGFSLYPNPASGQVQVVLDGAGAVADLSVIDAIGRTVLQQTLHGERSSVDLSGLRSGLYLAQVRRDGQAVTIKLIIN